MIIKPNISPKARLWLSTFLVLVGASSVHTDDLGAGGFAVVIDDKQVAGDPAFDESKYADYDQQNSVLDQTNIDVRFDGFDQARALDFQLFIAGDGLVAASYANYPAFIERGEILALRMVHGQAEIIARSTIGPNQERVVSLPQGDDVEYIYRVYDARGRYDQTVRKSIGSPYDIRAGGSALAQEGIPVFGGAVSVHVQNARPGARLATLGETHEVPASRGVVIQRILPPGQYDVDVDYQGVRSINLTRVVNIPTSDWFYVGVLDVEIGKYLESTADVDQNELFKTGRAAFFLRGRVRGDVLITAAADTGEGDLGSIFDGFDARTAESIIDRIDPDEYYPVYGDQSTIEEWAPTSGKFYIRIERDDDYAMWGNFRAEVDNDGYVRNERALYGAAVGYSTPPAHENGTSLLRFNAHAALPERLSARDEFLGTGGSFYFLSRQDVTNGTPNIYVEYRNPDTGRVIERVQFTEQVDYEVNAIQGLVSLAQPLSSRGPDDSEAVLIVEYEYTPLARETDDFSYAGRLVFAPSENVEIGISAIEEEDGDNARSVRSADLRLSIGEKSYLRGEYAQSDSSGRAYSYSIDGGLTREDIAAQTERTQGEAYKIETHIDFSDIQEGAEGAFDVYYEERSAGFRSSTTNVTSDEALYGIKIYVPMGDDEAVFRSDHYENEAGRRLSEAGLRVPIQVNERLKLTTELQYKSERTDTGEKGDELIVGLRGDYQINEPFRIYGYAESSVKHSGIYEYYEKYGIGAHYTLNEHWAISGELNTGTRGDGGLLRAEYKDENGNTGYFGYEVDPDRAVGRDDMNGRNGELVIGGKRQVNPDLSFYAESRYDLFGRQTSLANAFGVDYRLNEHWQLSGGIETGQVKNDTQNLERLAISLGADYSSGDNFSAQTRFEYRLDEGDDNGDAIYQETILAKASLRATPNPSLTYFADIGVLRADSSPILGESGMFKEAEIGLAYRPVDNDRLNVLFQLNVLDDDIGHVLNGRTSGQYDQINSFALDFRYDIDGYWDVGAKFAYRDAIGTDDDGATIHNRAFMFAPLVRYNVNHEWQLSASWRSLHLIDANLWDQAGTVAVYRNIGEYTKLGIGYHYGKFSNDITELDEVERSLFFNLVIDF